MNRQNTNENIMKKANEWIQTQCKTKEIKTIEQTLTLRRIKLLGHILRSPNDDPMRRLIFESNSAKSLTLGIKRVGGPKKNWTDETMSLAWTHLHHTHYVKTQAQQTQLLADALQRLI